jgi:hypothetical protein
MSSATCGETKRESSVRCRSTASIRRAFVSAIAAWSAGLDERDVVVGERLGFTAHEDDDPDQLVFDHDRHSEHRPVEARAGIDVLGVVEDVRDVDRFPREAGTAGRRRSVERMRMLLVVLRPRRIALMHC